MSAPHNDLPAMTRPPDLRPGRDRQGSMGRTRLQSAFYVVEINRQASSLHLIGDSVAPR
jgi:hypothetical protein